MNRLARRDRRGLAAGALLALSALTPARAGAPAAGGLAGEWRGADARREYRLRVGGGGTRAWSVHLLAITDGYLSYSRYQEFPAGGGRGRGLAVESCASLMRAEEVVAAETRYSGDGERTLESGEFRVKLRGDGALELRSIVACGKKQRRERGTVLLARWPEPPRGAGAPRVPVFLGDSVMMGTCGKIRDRFPDALCDAAVSRMPERLLDVVKQQRASGGLPCEVVLQIGNNGPFADGVLDALLDLLSDRRVYLITLHEKRPWADGNNAAIRDAAGKRPVNVVLLDWDALATSGDGWFGRDGIHLRPPGADAFLTQIDEAMRKAGPFACPR